MFQVEVADRSHLTALQRDEIATLCTRVYGEDFSDFWTNFADSWHLLGYWERELGKRELVSHAAWVLRWLQPEGLSPLRTAYVEAVVTDMLYQRRGFATQLMQRLQTEIADYELGGLSENPDVRHWYAKLGWESWRGALSIRTEQGIIPTADYHCMIFRLPRTSMLNLGASLSAEWRLGELW